jgi:hypothetical protein
MDFHEVDGTGRLAVLRRLHELDLEPRAEKLDSLLQQKKGLPSRV